MTIDNPSFSVVINTLERAGPLHTILQSLEQQSYSNFEVVVVVGPTKDNTMELLDQYAGRVRVMRCPTANLSLSRNIGIKGSRGDVIIFIDDDAVPCQRWLEQLAKVFAEYNVDLTGGSVWAIHPRFSVLQFCLGTYSALSEQQDVRDSLLEYIVPPGRAKQWITRITGGNMAFRREALLEVGGFDEFYQFVAEESDINLRMVNAGMNVYPVKEAIIYHIPASGPNRVVFTNKGRWWMRSRSRIYFGIKNGWIAGESFKEISRRSLLSMGAHLGWYGKLFLKRQMSIFDLIYFTANEFGGGLDALNHALFKPRQLIEPTEIESSRQSTEPVLQFQNEDSVTVPAVDPVTGYSPAVVLSEPPLRICLLSNTYPPTQYGGVGRLTNLMAKGLFELGNTVHVITRGEREETTFYDGAYVHKIPCRLEHYEQYRKFYNLYSTLNYSHDVYDKVRRLLINDGIQVVDSPLWQYEGLVTLQSGVLPVVVRLVTGLRQITAIHKQRVDEFSLMGDLEQSFIEQANYLMPNTQATLDNIRKVYDLRSAEDRYTIVPYGIVPAPDDQVRPFDTSRGDEPLTVLFVGRLEARKGVLDLFKAIPQVLAAAPDTQFIFAGSDNSQNDGFKLKNGMDYPTYFAAHYQKYASQVKFLGMVSDEMLQSLYQSCDLFVAPSLYESFGLIYLEAMNFAKPVIGCRAGGIPEVVDHGQTGILVDPEAPAELAEAILSFLKSPDKMRQMGLAARQQIIDKFSYIQMARNFERVYRNVVQAFEAGKA